MNFHGNNDDNKKGHKDHKGPMSHMFMMILCCAAPITLLLLLLLLKTIGIGTGTNSILPSIVVLICPIMMIGMMIMMMKGKKGGEDNHNQCTRNITQEEELEQVKKLEEKS